MEARGGGGENLSGCKITPEAAGVRIFSAGICNCLVVEWMREVSLLLLLLPFLCLAELSQRSCWFGNTGARSVVWEAIQYIVKACTRILRAILQTQNHISKYASTILPLYTHHTSPPITDRFLLYSPHNPLPPPYLPFFKQLILVPGKVLWYISHKYIFFREFNA